jgi:hypothetical protein
MRSVAEGYISADPRLRLHLFVESEDRLFAGVRSRDQRTHAAEKDTKLIDRNGRCGRVSHAGILPKPTPTGTVLSLTPEISRSPSIASMGIL